MNKTVVKPSSSMQQEDDHRSQKPNKYGRKVPSYRLRLRLFLCFTCPAITKAIPDGTVILRALDRVRERQLVAWRLIAQIPAHQASRGVLDADVVSAPYYGCSTLRTAY